ncbi:MAG: CehA/McbA family metallohydrolase [Clostridiales bacterium]|nr:CehA/McbA family metallohydrolase [Clostridiales bacterium]
MLKIISAGKPEEDAQFLLSGFSRAVQAEGVLSRKLSQVCRLTVPAGCVRLTLTLLSKGGANRLAAICNRDSAGELDLPPDVWTDFEIPLPAVGDAKTVELRFETDPFAFPQRLVYLSKIILDVPDEPLPGSFGLNRMMMKPVRNNTSHCSAHEIRKLWMIQPTRPFGDYEYSGEVNTYFGDLHVHTNYSNCGYPNNKTLEENARAAKERGHDFIAFTDHGEHMNPDAWRRYFEEMEEVQDKVGILVVPAVEWTSFEYGHRNVYFADNQPMPPRFDSRTFETDHPKKLGAFFKKHGLDAVAAGHHPAVISHPFDPDSIDDETEPLMEIFSTWGNFEHRGAFREDTQNTFPGLHVRDFLTRGSHFGFLGGGDAHNTMPGDGGLTAVLCPSLTRSDIHAALKKRLCYATSGDKILLDFHINGYPMGSVIKINQYTIEQFFPIHIAASAIAPDTVRKIELIQNGSVVHEKSVCEGKRMFDLALDYDRLMSPDRFDNSRASTTANLSRYYYIRVTQTDGGAAWSSPIFIDYKQNI